MPGVSFTREEVEAAAGVAPWRRQREFTSEINPADMEATAAAYARAAGEARSAQDLGERATQISQQAGGVDGSSLVNGQGRIDETNQALQRGGDDIDAVVGYLVRAMNAGLETHDQVRALIYAGGTGLETKYSDHLKAASDEWSAWHQALGTAVAEWNGEGAARFIAPPDVHHNGEVVSAVQAGASGNSIIWALPGDMAERVRAKHLTNAATDATGAHTEMDHLIEVYRRRLASYGNELGKRGYDALDGPLDLFKTSQMGAFSAQQLKAELAGGNPDPHIVQMYTRNLGLIEDAVNANPAQPDRTVLRDPSGILTQEGQYVQAFLDNIGPDALGQLGRMDDAHGMRDTKTDVANTINTWMNPDAGGINPAVSPVPESIRPFVYDYAESGLIPATNVGGHFTGGLGEAWQRYNGFGDLMSTATVASGSQFSKDLGHAAVTIEAQSQMPVGEGYVPPVNTGSSGLLHAASLNSFASAQLLNEEDFRRGLLNQSWDRSTGAGELIRSGTNIPPGPGTVETREYAQAAYHVLVEAPDYKSSLLAPGADNTALLDAIGDAAINNMDHIASPPVDGSPQGGLSRANDGEPIPNDQNPYGFRFGREERENLFTLMNETDEDAVRKPFFADVARWQYGTALDAFRDANAVGNVDGSEFRKIGVIQGTVADVQSRQEVDELENWSTVSDSIDAISALAGTVPHPVPQGASGVLSAGTAVTSPFLESALDEAKEKQQQQIELMGIEARFAIANAAVEADYAGAGERADDPRRIPPTPGTPPEESVYDPAAFMSDVLSMERVSNPVNEFDHAFTPSLGG